MFDNRFSEKGDLNKHNYNRCTRKKIKYDIRGIELKICIELPQKDWWADFG